MPLSKRERWMIKAGLNDRMTVLLPNMEHAPMIVPYCRLCGMPVEHYQIPKTDWHGLDIDGSCCGKHQGRRVTIEELRRLHAENEKLWLIVGRGQAQLIEGIGKRIQATVGGLPVGYKITKKAVK